MGKKKGKLGGKREGAGRPRSADPPVVVSASVPTTVAIKLDAWAERHEMTRAQAVREAIRKLLT